MVETPAKYSIGIDAIGRYKTLSISEESATQIFESVDLIQSAVGFEDRFSIIVDNFIELETAVFRISILEILRPHDVFREAKNQIRDLNRLVLNTLSSIRQYVDHGHSAAKRSGVEFKQLLSVHYDESLAFRVMEAIRNYAQHKDFSAHRLKIRQHWNKEKTKLRFAATAILLVKKLELDRDFKSSVLAELKRGTEEHDLIVLLREYIERISQTHADVRQQLDERVDDAVGLVQHWHKIYVGDDLEFASAPIALHRTTGEFREKLCMLSTKPAERHNDLIEFNYCSPNLSKSVVISDFGFE